MNQSVYKDPPPWMCITSWLNVAWNLKAVQMPTNRDVLPLPHGTHAEAKLWSRSSVWEEGGKSQRRGVTAVTSGPWDYGAQHRRGRAGAVTTSPGQPSSSWSGSLVLREVGQAEDTETMGLQAGDLGVSAALGGWRVGVCWKNDQINCAESKPWNSMQLLKERISSLSVGLCPQK